MPQAPDRFPFFPEEFDPSGSLDERGARLVTFPDQRNSLAVSGTSIRPVA